MTGTGNGIRRSLLLTSEILLLVFAPASEKKLSVISNDILEDDVKKGYDEDVAGKEKIGETIY
jgi:hypothetical protein